eukprot:8265845-Pyramimonas_sp.AAC.1
MVHHGLCTLRGAIHDVQSTWCNICGAIFSAWCNLSGAVNSAALRVTTSHARANQPPTHTQLGCKTHTVAIATVVRRWLAHRRSRACARRLARRATK